MDNQNTNTICRCAIEFFGDVFVLSLNLFDISVGTRDFVIGQSQTSSLILLPFTTVE